MITSDFYLRVFEIVRLIPSGRVTTYGHIAKCLGTGKGARVVGYAMNASHHHDPAIPAHRVVNRNGMLTGKVHFNPPESMQKQLEEEGIRIKDDCIVDFGKHLWDPMSLAADL